ncbi:hypothetical protein TNCT_514261, partial [Trichonephila clavata]
SRVFFIDGIEQALYQLFHRAWYKLQLCCRVILERLSDIMSSSERLSDIMSDSESEYG